MIQWYPGHMAKAIKEINEKIKLVDLVIVLLDARAPNSSMNPELNKSLQNKRTLYVLTKKDKADESETKRWLKYYQDKNIPAIAINVRNNKDVKMVIKEAENLMAEKRLRDEKKGLRPRPIKTMMVGIPNVGKSTLINALVGKKVTMVADKPGVTKVQQWIRINQNLELLDTPGVLWSKFENEETGFHLALTGAINDNILPIMDIALYLIDFLIKYYKEQLINKYSYLVNITSSAEILELIAKNERCFLANKEYDLDNASRLIIQNFRNNELGLITLDRVENEKAK